MSSYYTCRPHQEAAEQREGGESMAMKETEAKMNLQKVDIEIDATIISACQKIHVESIIKSLYRNMRYRQV